MPVSGADYINSNTGLSVMGADSIGEARTKSEKNSDISMNEFFTLLAAQMQNQTMYDSVDTSEYMSQLAQYTTLAQIQELNASVSTSYAVSLIGKTVGVASTDAQGNDIFVAGTVDEVAFQDGKPYICVNGGYYQTADILSVSGLECKDNGEEALPTAQGEATDALEQEGGEI